MFKSPARFRLASLALLLSSTLAAPAFAQTQPSEPAKPAAEKPADKPEREGRRDSRLVTAPSRAGDAVRGRRKQR